MGFNSDVLVSLPAVLIYIHPTEGITNKRVNRDGDTRDVNFRICAFPNTKNLYIGTGGSGHGFKFMPIIGKYIADMLEGKLDKEYAELWKWRFGATPVKTGQEPHPWPQRDLGELDGWRGRNARVVRGRL